MCGGAEEPAPLDDREVEALEVGLFHEGQVRELHHAKRGESR